MPPFLGLSQFLGVSEKVEPPPSPAKFFSEPKTEVSVLHGGGGRLRAAGAGGEQRRLRHLFAALLPAHPPGEDRRAGARVFSFAS